MLFLTKSVYTLILLSVLFLCASTSSWAASSDNAVTSRISHATAAYFSGNYEQALTEFLPMAEQGNADARYYTGLIYSIQDWSKHNPSLALSYLLSAAEQNHAMAMLQIGQMYDDGYGVPRDALVALDWRRKAVKAAQMAEPAGYIEFFDENNQTIPEKQLVDKLKQAAQNGDVDAQFGLASLYDSGQLLPEDPELAFYWYLQAAMNDDQTSMLMAGYFLCRGLAGETDLEKANYWLQKYSQNITCSN